MSGVILIAFIYRVINIFINDAFVIITDGVLLFHWKSFSLAIKQLFIIDFDWLQFAFTNFLC